MRVFDTQNMHETLYRVPEQIRQAVGIGENAPLFTKKASSNRYAVFGLGGSAIGADLVRSYAAATKGADHLMISVHRGYDAPAWIDKDTNVICSSYSGDTEETLSAFDQARKRTERMLCVTTGGKIGAKAAKAGIPVIHIPQGYQPRCALAFSFFPLLAVFQRSGAFEKGAVTASIKGMREAIHTIESLRDLYASASPKNPAFALAKKLHGSYPVIYSASDRLDAVNLRWRGQIQENAKQVAFGNVLPEMNHNEINGWQHPKGMTKNFKVVLLRDPADHKRVSLRFDALAEIIRKNVGSVQTVTGQGDTLLSRMFSLIYLGDWVSYHLAYLNGTDPTPVPIIQSLKARLAGS
jgi:glucose/mannose-6-phosphate isomerase